MRGPAGILGTADPRQPQRDAELRRFVLDLARREFDERHPGVRSEPVLVLICAYLEADNIGAVLRGIPERVHGLGTTTLVVIDGGDDGTDKVVQSVGALGLAFPVNLGHGVALRAGYELADQMGARYVVTLDADGQNDPSEIPQLVKPLVDGSADFVVASRRLGVDHTTDRFRRSGVVVFSEVINRITGQRLTDTSNGYRALRIEVLNDIRDRLQQDQYQTAEVIITAARRGWRLGERPTVWHPRASGTSKKGRNVFFGYRYASVIIRTWWRERHEVAHRAEA